MTGLVILGAGQAGCQLAISLRQGGYQDPITLIGDEPDPPYQRPPLSKDFLAGKLTEPQLPLRPQAWFVQNNITLRLGLTATKIDRQAQTLTLDNSETISYTHLVLATGARHRRLAIPGANRPNVHSVRTLAEARAFKPKFAEANTIAIIGAGFIGLEIAALATEAGKHVEIIEATAQPLCRALSPPMAQILTQAHREAGVKFHLEANAAEITETGLTLTTGTKIPAEQIVIGIGVLPNTALAAQAGLPTANGIVVNAELLTEDPAISAIGDCAAAPSRFAPGQIRLESVQNAVDQARTVAARLLGRPEPYAAVPWFWSHQGRLALQIAGLTQGHDRTIARGDSTDLHFSIFCFAGEKLLGVESLNRPADHMAARRLLAQNRPLTQAQAADTDFDLKAWAS